MPIAFESIEAVYTKLLSFENITRSHCWELRAWWIRSRRKRGFLCCSVSGDAFLNLRKRKVLCICKIRWTRIFDIGSWRATRSWKTDCTLLDASQIIIWRYREFDFEFTRVCKYFPYLSLLLRYFSMTWKVRSFLLINFHGAKPSPFKASVVAFFSTDKRVYLSILQSEIRFKPVVLQCYTIRIIVHSATKFCLQVLMFMF